MEKYIIVLDNIEIPKYARIAQHIKKLIDDNLIEDGEKLPSIRKLSSLLKVNNVTIVNAYNKLQNEGYAFQKVGSGTYAKRKNTAISFKKKYGRFIRKTGSEKNKVYIDFSGEEACAELFPISTFKNVVNEVLDRDGAEALVYQEALGYEGLRKSIDESFWNNKMGKDNILVVSGAQQGIDIVSKALINVNDNVVVEKPTYGGALTVFKWRRANIFEIEVGKGGMDLDQLDKIAKKNKIRCVYIMSYFQNPTGVSYSMENKRRLLNLAQIYDFYIIEDDYLSELIYNGNEYKSFKSIDTNDRVIYIKSFSKIFLPGIRLGYMISPQKFKESIQNSKVNTDIATSSLMQRALDLYIREGMWKKHINILNEVYKKRYMFMKEKLKELEKYISFYSPGGGLHFYIDLKEGKMNCLDLFFKCKKEGVLITPGVIFYKDPEEGLNHFRLGFSQTKEKDIEKGIDIIKNILENN
ncbi:DNA-binding transcriptional MocR family regulator [Clostridium tetanomorphum]|uniref:PLP-dependent aminotransferase family protein n=1 Tax=Clostridium tetanomorphum TaxID=1553 RepID=A0A923E8P4_CLOTT|nr:PLP-dependent aminotransferase family protein [Clostridium tetanomorphum]KAJ53667.1 GntR family transcriptional regulator [Clostridium tetanomorphum DSM 665]MBC2397176.1 PLP-dependent aminotransferase family protein [Clostridium tetanomorphum]MBP1862389.1 DNA-binding transcriptional MocR family regulator [Clostridium tetanomorphum]NRS85771.1 DNA-binding transcriptional MocR family regulator [Clostridium tetanomorphum]NRZ96220.1 DNA-binding transcriptional MocR family regulator [Clostridium 